MQFLKTIRCCGAAVRPRGQVKAKVEVEKERVLRLRLEAEGKMSNDHWEMPNVKAQMPKGRIQMTNDGGRNTQY